MDKVTTQEARAKLAHLSDAKRELEAELESITQEIEVFRRIVEGN